MTWRVHLSDDTIYRLDPILEEPEQLCAWATSSRATFMDLWTGVLIDEFDLIPPVIEDRQSEVWQEFVGSLRAPNGAALPVVRTANVTIHTTLDGQMRLYDDGHGLSVEIEGHELPLGQGEAGFVAVGLDRSLGVIAALDEQGLLYLYQQHIPVGVFDIGLQVTPGLLPELVIADNGVAIFASDGHQVILADTGGNVLKRLKVTYSIGKLACTRQGDWIITSDSETGVLRVYDGHEFVFTHQKFAIDLMAAAQQVQLLADIPTPRLGISALAITDEGIVAFAIDGVVIVSSIQQMEELPRPQSLL